MTNECEVIYNLFVHFVLHECHVRSCIKENIGTLAVTLFDFKANINISNKNKLIKLKFSIYKPEYFILKSYRNLTLKELYFISNCPKLWNSNLILLTPNISVRL